MAPGPVPLYLGDRPPPNRMRAVVFGDEDLQNWKALVDQAFKYQMPFNNLPIWKQIIYVIVIVALAYFIYKIFKDLLKAVQSILSAIVSLISALIAMLPQIVLVGLIAFGGAWVIATLNPSWMPQVLVGGKSG